MVSQSSGNEQQVYGAAPSLRFTLVLVVATAALLWSAPYLARWIDARWPGQTSAHATCPAPLAGETLVIFVNRRAEALQADCQTVVTRGQYARARKRLNEQPLERLCVDLRPYWMNGAGQLVPFGEAPCRE